MMKKNYLVFMLITALLYSCQKEKVGLPDNTVNFTASEVGIGTSESSKEITVNLGRATAGHVELKISLSETEVAYGKDYTTTPAAANGQISLTLKAGEASSKISVNKVGKTYDKDASVTFTINSANQGIVLGQQKTITVNFSEIISKGDKMTLNGGAGGAEAENMVYVHLSNNTQTAILRKSWNLGLYCGDKDAIKLNNATTSMATLAEKGSLGKIMDEAAASAYKNQLKLDYTSGPFKYLDSWDGDITKTIVKIGTEYVVNPGGKEDPLYIVQVDKKDADTYTVRYSKVTEETIHSIEVKKDKAYDYQYVSFESGKAVPVEPAKTKWDILYGKFSYYTTFPGKPDKLPYNFSDLIFSNSANGVEVAQVKTSETAFDKFGSADIKALPFSKAVDAIGSTWREGGGPGKQPTVKQDIFYVVKDAAGNYYKLRFLNMSASDGGERGKPQIEYELVK